MPLNQDQYFGSGIIFPIELTPSGLPIIRKGSELIPSSIKTILSWPYNQRIFLNQFGSRLNELLEEPNDELLKGLVNFFIRDSLRNWEKRITVVDVGIARKEPEDLEVNLIYQNKITGLEDVFTFPFYKTILT